MELKSIGHLKYSHKAFYVTACLQSTDILSRLLLLFDNV